MFDNTVADRSHSHSIEGVCQQYFSNAGGVVRGIVIVTCVYCNASADRFWILDYRIFDPDRDSKIKLDYVSEMLDSLTQREIACRTVLMNSPVAPRPN